MEKYDKSILLWIVFAASYLLFAGQARETELVALVPTATAVRAFALLCRGAQNRRLDRWISYAAG